MKQGFRHHLLIAAALGAISVAAYAQPNDASSAQQDRMSASAQKAENDYLAAKQACINNQTGYARTKCLRDAQKDYDNASSGAALMGGGPGAGTTSGTAPLSHSAKK